MATIDGNQKKLTVSGEAIEGAVNSKHEHINKTVLDKLSDNNGNLQYNGSDITGGTTTNIDGGVFTEVASLTSISAVYTQGNSVVYPSTSLNGLKSNLVVTATYSDSTSATVTDYTLSGTLLVGTSTITVSYEGKNTIFEVTVSEEEEPTTTSYVSGYYDDTGKLVTAEHNYVDNKYIPVSGETTYNVVAPAGVERVKFNEFDSDKNFIRRQNGSVATDKNEETQDSFTTDSTTAYVRVGFAIFGSMDNKNYRETLFSNYTCKQ